MRLHVFILLLISTMVLGQSTIESNYTWDYIIKVMKKNKMDYTKATNEIISDIAIKYDSSKEQIEFITFYNSSYDYKIVDKTILNHLIDSLALNGLTPEIRSLAIDARNSGEYRFLNKKIRDFEFPDKNEKAIRLSSLNDKIVIIELWATWCGPCIKEMKGVAALKQQNLNIEFYSISLDKTLADMRKFVDKNNYDWPIVFGGNKDMNKELWEYLRIEGIPKYFVVDRTGIVIQVSDKLDEQFIKSLK